MAKSMILYQLSNKKKYHNALKIKKFLIKTNLTN